MKSVLRQDTRHQQPPPAIQYTQPQNILLYKIGKKTHVSVQQRARFTRRKLIARAEHRIFGVLTDEMAVIAPTVMIQA